MTLGLLFLIVGVAVLLFLTEKVSVDVVALLVVGALLGTGLLSPAEGLSGFGNPATLTVAAMFVLSAALSKTGALAALGAVLVRHGRNETWLLLLVVAAAGTLSTVLNNTAVVAVFLPLVLRAAATRDVPSSKLLIPLSFASQFGGVCTLIGTSTNLVVDAFAQQSGLPGFSFFEFTGLGLIMYAAGALYLLLVGRWLLPARLVTQLTDHYQLGEYVTELRVMPGSTFVGRSVAQLRLGETHDVSLLELIRGDQKLWSPEQEALREGDLLLVRGAVRKLVDLKHRARLEIEPQFELRDEHLEDQEHELTEVLLAPQSRLAGRTIHEIDFRRRFKSTVLALHRRGEVLREKLALVPLQFGDALLLLGPKEEIDRLRRDDSFIVLEPSSDVALHRGRAPLAVAIGAVVVGLAAVNALPIVVSALLGCAALILTRCLRPEDAYRAVDWKVIVLMGGMLPLGLALEKTGAARLLAELALGWTAGAGPTVVLGTLYFVAALLTAFISNTATAALLAPVAIVAANEFGADPRPFLVAIVFGASACFATPVGYHTNTMVYQAGGYRFVDFVKVGLPLNLLFWGLAVHLIPKFWPF